MFSYLFGKPSKTWLSVFLQALAAAMITTGSLEGAIVYRFTGTGSAGPGGPAIPVAFQLTTADYIRPPLSGDFTRYDCALLDSRTNCASDGRITISRQGAGLFSTLLTIDTGNNTTNGFYLPCGAFTQAGLYTANSFGTLNAGTLSVISTQEPVPPKVVYRFTGIGTAFAGLQDLPVAFQLTTPGFVRVPPSCDYMAFPCDSLDSHTNCGFQGVNVSIQSGFGTQLTFDGSNNAAYNFFFPASALGNPGSYVAGGGNPGNLSVSVAPADPTTPPSSVPELSGWGLGLLACLLAGTAALCFSRSNRAYR